MNSKILLAAILIACCISACGTSRQAEQPGTIDPVPDIAGTSTDSGNFPLLLPDDALQPWETAGRSSSGIGPDSEFIPGREWFLGSTEGLFENAEAARLSSPAEGIAYGIYRIPMAGVEPGTVSADVNLLADGSGAPSQYYLAAGNYATDRWEWHGPFSDSHVRISTGARIRAGASYLSSVGNAFVCVLCFDGNTADIVGVGASAYQDSDSSGPVAPLGLMASPVSGGLELTWNAVAEADLAGYRIHHSSRSFINPHSAGVKTADMLEGSTRFLLTGVSGTTFVRLSSVDNSGNEGPASDMVSALPLDGAALSVSLQTDLVSGSLGSTASLTAGGAEIYDFDLDGDGIFEQTGNTTGMATVDTSNPGIIRPRVRGTSADGEAVALGAVSLIIAGNSRPVASASATPTSGDTPLPVSFSGAESVDFDGSIVGGGWDFDGDGIFNVWDDTDIVHVLSANATFTKPGVYNAKLRVVDDQGAWDVDTLTIIVGGNDPSNFAPTASFTGSTTGGSAPLLVSFDASASSDSDGSIVNYEWDFNGDGQYDSYGSSTSASHSYSSPGNFPCRLRVTDDKGAQHSTTFDITARSDTWVVQAVDEDTDVGRYSSLAVVDGNPAISYYDTDHTNLKYVRALDINGEDWGSPMTLDNVFSVGEYTSMAVVDGNPAISYYADVQQDLKYIRATDPQGTAWGAFVRVDTDGNVGKYTSMTIVEGRPAIAYYDQTNMDLKFARAADITGSLWLSPLSLDTTDDVGRYPSMAIVAGNPAISYWDGSNSNLKYVRASAADGSSWFSPVVVDGAFAGLISSLMVVNGRPAISYYKYDTANRMYVRAADSLGSTWGNGQIISGGATTSFHGSMAIVDGLPVVCYLGQSGLDFVVASDVNGDAWEVPEEEITGGSDGIDISMEIVNGSPAFTYYDLFGSKSLFYARLY